MQHRQAVILLLAMMMFHGCTPQNTNHLRIGVTQWPSYELLRLATHSEVNSMPADIQVVDFFTPIDLLQAYKLGQVDGLACTLSEFLQIHDEGQRDPVIIGVIDASHGADVILGPDSLDGPEDLRGLRIGVEAGTVGDLLLANALTAGGLEPGDVHRVPFHLQLDNGPLAASGLDAVVCFPPFSTHLMNLGGLKPLFDSSRLTNPIFDVLAVERTVLSTQPQVAVELLLALEGARQVRQQRGQWADSLMGVWEGISAQEFTAAFTGLTLYRLDEQPGLLERELPSSLKAAHRLLFQQGILRNNPVAGLELVNPKAAREAQGAR